MSMLISLMMITQVRIEQSSFICKLLFNCKNSRIVLYNWEKVLRDTDGLNCSVDNNVVDQAVYISMPAFYVNIISLQSSRQNKKKCLNKCLIPRLSYDTVEKLQYEIIALCSTPRRHDCGSGKTIVQCRKRKRGRGSVEVKMQRLGPEGRSS